MDSVKSVYSAYSGATAQEPQDKAAEEIQNILTRGKNGIKLQVLTRILYEDAIPELLDVPENKRLGLRGKISEVKPVPNSDGDFQVTLQLISNGTGKTVNSEKHPARTFIVDSKGFPKGSAVKDMQREWVAAKDYATVRRTSTRELQWQGLTLNKFLDKLKDHDSKFYTQLREAGFPEGLFDSLIDEEAALKFFRENAEPVFIYHDAHLRLGAVGASVGWALKNDDEIDAFEEAFLESKTALAHGVNGPAREFIDAALQEPNPQAGQLLEVGDNIATNERAKHTIERTTLEEAREYAEDLKEDDLTRLEKKFIELLTRLR